MKARSKISNAYIFLFCSLTYVIRKSELDIVGVSTTSLKNLKHELTSLDSSFFWGW